MGEVELNFVDSMWADDTKLTAAKNVHSATDVNSVRDLVDNILKGLPPGDCIKSVNYFGHGSPGYINVGGGRYENQNANATKNISMHNRDVWESQFARLKCLFCPDKGTFNFWACGAGADLAGARLLHLIMEQIQCAVVSAPIGPTSFLKMGETQRAIPGESRFPDPKPNQLGNPDRWPPYVPSIAGGPTVFGGTGWSELIAVSASDVLAARYAPVLNGAFPEHEGESLTPDPMACLRCALEEPRLAELSYDLLSVGGTLRLQIATDGGPQWLPPGAILGGGALYAPFGADTSVVYILPRSLQRVLNGLHDRELARSAQLNDKDTSYEDE